MATAPELVMDAEGIARTVRRLAHEIVERAQGTERLALVGIRRGGVPLAARIASAIADAEKKEIPVGTVEIALYRDDAATALPDPKIGPSRIDFEVADREVVLVDDVMQTGRTVRAAIDCLLDYGRPRRIWLAVLLDRGGRELPIAPDFCGQVVEVPPSARLEVDVETAGQERAVCVRRSAT
jgi:pyrimidine operon attenuation protein/uracil phosphoribosyltransferase